MFNGDSEIMRITLLIGALIGIVSYSVAQVGGQGAFEFLRMPVSARATALGGSFITVMDDDPTVGIENPSLLNEGMTNKLGLSYNSHFAGINNGTISYARHFENIGSTSMAVQFIDYGTFEETDAGGNLIGEFGANEFAVTMGYARKLDSSFSVGGNLKYVYSSLYNYVGMGLAVDLSANYLIEEQSFLATILIKNMGYQFFTYTDGERESLPFEIQAGISKQFKNMPFRFNILLHHLNNFNLAYENPNATNSGNFFDEEENNNSGGFGDELSRHLTIGVEFIPSKNFHVRAAYNFQRRKEMVLDNRPGGVGLSWGFGFRISKLRFSYARSTYHLTGSPNHFTVVTKISDWAKKS